MRVVSLPSKILGMPADEYHARPEWSHSQRKLLPNHPELFHGYHVTHEWEFKQTDDMWLGECLHAVCLEGKSIVEIPDYALTSNGQRRGKAWEAWQAEHANDFYLLPKEAERVLAMRDGLMADPKCRAFLEAEGQCEASYFYIDEETGLQCRARVDKLATFGRIAIIGDLKATNIDPTDARQVGLKVLEMGYHRQGAEYTEAVGEVDGETPDGFGFLFVRNRVPYNARLWVLKSEDIELGWRQNHAALRDLRRRLDSNDWIEGDTFGKENPITLPRWAYSDQSVGDAPYEEFAAFNGEDNQS